MIDHFALVQQLVHITHIVKQLLFLLAICQSCPIQLLNGKVMQYCTIADSLPFISPLKPTPK